MARESAFWDDPAWLLVVTKPAYTWLNPVTKFLLRHLLPAHYARIRGEPANGMAVDADVDSRTDAPDQRGAVS
jgi:hypothetical protein